MTVGNCRSVIVDLHISADQYLKLYQGVATSVLAYAQDGRRVRFPARILQPFVSREGVHGRFRILFDAEGRFQRIERL